VWISLPRRYAKSLPMVLKLANTYSLIDELVA